jgi:hypothetical protein
MKYAVLWDVRRQHFPLYECSMLCVISLLLISLKQFLPHTLPIIFVQVLKSSLTEQLLVQIYLLRLICLILKSSTSVPYLLK